MVNEKTLSKIALRYLGEARPGDYEHTMRVVKLVKRLLKSECGDPKIIIPAAYLHDIGWMNLIPPNEQNSIEGLRKYDEEHYSRGRDFAFKELRKLKYPLAREVAEAIYKHQPRNRISPDTSESKVLSDADNIAKLNPNHIATKYSGADKTVFINLLKKKQLCTQTGQKMYKKLLRDLLKTDLSRVINPLGTSPKVYEAIKASLPNISTYSALDPRLPELIAKKMSVGEENVLVADGADVVLDMLASTLFRGRKIVVPRPCFPRYKAYVKRAEGEIVFVPPEGDLNLDEKKILETEGDILLFATPNNPTGFCVSGNFVEQALNKFKLVIVDETLALDLNSYASLLDKYENLIVVRSFSKLFGLAGMRIGFMVSNEPTCLKVSKFLSPYKVSYLSQQAAIAALGDADFIKKTKNFIEKERRFLYDELGDKNILDSKSICYAIKLGQRIAKNIVQEFILQKDIGFGYGTKDYFRASISSHKANVHFANILKEILN